MTNEIEKAKEMYFNYSCNEYYMKVDGVLDEYKNYGISTELQKQWKNEYILSEFNKLKKEDDIKSLKNIQNFIKENHDVNALVELYKYYSINKNSNDYLKLSKICSAIVSSISLFMLKGKEEFINKILMDVLDSITSIMLKIDDKNVNMIFAEADTINRIKKILETTKKSLLEITDFVKK